MSREVDFTGIHSALGLHLPSNKAFETYANYEATTLSILLKEAVLAATRALEDYTTKHSFHSRVKDEALEILSAASFVEESPPCLNGSEL